jgi:hypothetical protein
MLRGIVEVFAAASTGAAGPFYGTTGRRKQRVAAAELSVQQDLSKDHDSPGAADAAVDSDGAAVPSEELRAGTDPPDGYAGVNRGKRTTRPRDLPGAGRRVSPMLGFWAKASTRRSTDRARAG